MSENERIKEEKKEIVLKNGRIIEKDWNFSNI